MFPTLNALPNLHPAVVHLPIALLPAAVLFDLMCLAAPTWTWLDRGAAALYALAACGAGGAYLAGESAEESLGPIPAAVRAVLRDHQHLARLTLIACIVLALLRLALAWRDRDRPRIGVGPLRLLVAAAALGAVLLLADTADHGGALVYRHGVGVTAASPPAP